MRFSHQRNATYQKLGIIFVGKYLVKKEPMHCWWKIFLFNFYGKRSGDISLYCYKFFTFLSPLFFYLINFCFIISYLNDLYLILDTVSINIYIIFLYYLLNTWPLLPIFHVKCYLILWVDFIFDNFLMVDFIFKSIPLLFWVWLLSFSLVFQDSILSYWPHILRFCHLFGLFMIAILYSLIRNIIFSI